MSVLVASDFLIGLIEPRHDLVCLMYAFDGDTLTTLPVDTSRVARLDDPLTVSGQEKTAFRHVDECKEKIKKIEKQVVALRSSIKFMTENNPRAGKMIRYGRHVGWESDDGTRLTRGRAKKTRYALARGLRPHTVCVMESSRLSTPTGAYEIIKVSKAKKIKARIEGELKAAEEQIGTYGKSIERALRFIEDLERIERGETLRIQNLTRI